MSICKYIVLFALCSFVGWVFESLLAIVKTGKWERRGFLYGPVCPIYGVGVAVIVLVAKALVMELNAPLEWWWVFLAAFLGSMVLEYTVHWALEKLFDACWWDYSDMPLNINGRTCIPAACLFGVGGLAAVYAISPFWDALASNIPPVVMELAALIIVVLLTVDATLTVNALTQFQKQVDSFDRMFNQKASDMTDLLTERLYDQGIAHISDALNAAQRAALMRVQGFRRPRAASILQAIKEFRKNGR